MALSQGVICTKRVDLGLSEVAFIEIEGCPHIRVGLYEGFHCIYIAIQEREYFERVLYGECAFVLRVLSLQPPSSLF